MNIFVSRPTWVAPEFEEGLKVFLAILENNNLKPRTLGASDYPSKAPLDEVIEIMDQCSGAVVLGYPQISIESGVVKEEKLDSELVLPTEWNHIETALAYSKGLPVLVIHHESVRRGVFDRGVMNAFVHSFDLKIPSWPVDTALGGAITAWKNNCEKGNSNFPSSKPIESDLPFCPNCSTSSQKTYMTELGSDFKMVGKWLCPKCDLITR